jgi:membrane-bound lytic murein transglycosylase D
MLKKSTYQIIFIFLILCGIFACSPSDYKPSDPDPAPDSNAVFSAWPTDNPAEISINGNLWDDMQDYLQLPDYSYRPEVQKQIVYLQRHQAYLNRTIKQSAPYIYYIFQQTQQRNLPAELALIPIIESAYNPFKYSYAGANGLWQLMPGTASGLGLKINWWYDGRRDIIASTKVAFDYLSYLNDFFTNNWLLAIAAYDYGEGGVKAAISHNKHHGLSTDFWSLHLPAETKVYVPKLLALAAVIRDPERYGINLQPINDAPYLKEVDVGSQIDLTQAAKLAGISVSTIHKLNPGFRRWATDPDGPYTLLLPISKVRGFEQRLDALPENKRVTWREHIVKQGETLGSLAVQYKTNTFIIKQVNHLHNDMIHPKQLLLIPVQFHGSVESPVVKERATIAEEKLPGPNRVSHIVQHGETLWTLAEKYGVTPREIRYWNSLKPHQQLALNQKLLIWAPPHAKLVHTHIYRYKVQPGDSLWVVAHQFNASMNQIRRTNHIKANTIHAGQILTIPSRVYRHQQRHYTAHTVKTGDNLDKIAHEFHTTTKNLIKWNHLQDTKYLHPGQKIYIYPSA